MQHTNDQVIFVNDHHRRGGYGSDWSSGPDDMYDYQYDQRRDARQFNVMDNRDVHFHNGEPPRMAYARDPIGQNVEVVDEDENEVEHLQADQMYGIQKTVIVAAISGSLSDLMSPSKSTFKIQPNNLKNFRVNSRTTNRTNATKDDFTGDLSKTVILDARLISSGNHYPVPIGVEYTKMEPRHLTSTDAYQHMLKPAVPYVNENRSIYKPDSVFTANMYTSYGKCDKKSLDYQVKFEGNDNEATVYNNGIIWNTIMDNVGHMESWASSADHIYDLNEAKFNGPRHQSPWVVIPRHIAKDVYDQVACELKKIEKSFVNLNDFRVKFSRADGKNWNDIKGLIGQHAASNSETQKNYNDYAINKEGYAYAEVEISYITYD